MDVGLHDDGIEGHIDAAPGLQDGGEEAASAELGDSQLNVTGLGGQQPWTVTVALGRAITGPLIAPGTDNRGQLGLDELLADQADGFSDEVQTLTRLEGSEQLGQDRLIKGHRCVLLWWVRLGTHRGSRRWPPYGWTLGLTSKPTIPRDTASIGFVKAVRHVFALA